LKVYKLNLNRADNPKIYEIKPEDYHYLKNNYKYVSGRSDRILYWRVMRYFRRIVGDDK